MPAQRTRTRPVALAFAAAFLLAAAGGAAQEPPEQQPTEKPSAEKQPAEKPSTEQQQPIEKPPVEQPPSAERQPAEQPSAEQPPVEQPLAERTRIVSVNFGMQFIQDAFMNRVTFQQHDETGSFESHYDVTKHHALDGGIAFRLWRNLALGFVGSHVAEPTTARVDAQVPHPHFFGFSRPASGVRRGLNRREIGLHVQGQYWWFVNETFLLRATWGPTIFIARQDLVSQIDTREASDDFDQVMLTGHRSRTVTAGSLGLNLGFDGTWLLTERVGVGFGVRYSRGTATVRLGGRSATPLELGGTHAGGGLRLAF